MNLKILPRVLEKMILDNVLEHHYFEIHKAKFKKTLVEINRIFLWYSKLSFDNETGLINVFNGTSRIFTKIRYMKSIYRNGKFVDIGDVLRSDDTHCSFFDRDGCLCFLTQMDF